MTISVYTDHLQIDNNRVEKYTLIEELKSRFGDQFREFQGEYGFGLVWDDLGLSVNINDIFIDSINIHMSKPSEYSRSPKQLYKGDFRVDTNDKLAPRRKIEVGNVIVRMSSDQSMIGISFL